MRSELSERLIKRLQRSIGESERALKVLDAKYNKKIADLNVNTAAAHAALSEDGAIKLFPTCALMNHSCAPNCVISRDGVVTAVRPIKLGEELTISYLASPMGQHTYHGNDNAAGMREHVPPAGALCWPPPLLRSS